MEPSKQACCYAGIEFVGEVCADFLGLNDSQYQWIIDEQRRREEEVWLYFYADRSATNNDYTYLLAAAEATAPFKGVA